MRFLPSQAAENSASERYSEGGNKLFGYVLPYQADLKVWQWQAYRAYYCGLCMQLKERYGFLPRFVLNYDFVFLALLADGLSGEEPLISSSRCIANPIQRHPICQVSKGLAMAADALVLTAYYKIIDDVSDERAAKRMLSVAAQGLFHRAQEKAGRIFPELQTVLKTQTQCQANLEAKGCADPDEAADPTAQMTAALFSLAAAEPSQQAPLRHMGMLLGKVLYYLDAAEDFDSDGQSGSYNVFQNAKLSRENMIAQVTLLCRMCAGEAARRYGEISIESPVHKALIENILFLGLPQSISKAGQKRTRKPTTHLSSLNGKEIL